MWRQMLIGVGFLGSVLAAKVAEASVQRFLAPEGVELLYRFEHAEVKVLPCGKAVAFLYEPAAAFVPDSTAGAAECITLLMAIPPGSELPTLQWKVQRWRQWEHSTLARVGEIVAGCDTTTAGRLLPAVELQPIGVWRGIPLAVLRVCPWEYEPEQHRVRLWAELSIRIRYPQPVTPAEVEESWGVVDRVFAQLLLNAEHAAAFRRHGDVHAVRGEPFRLSGPAVRLTTTQDGIAAVALRDVLRQVPEWRGASVQRLRLLWRGMSVPVLLRDTDGVLDESDTLIFFGRRPAGDTTWLDFYTAEEPFLLLLGDSAGAPRFVPFPTGTGQQQATILPTLVHWERDRTYVYGANADFMRFRTETAPGEGWYWATLTPRSGADRWQDSLQLPTGDTLELRFAGYAFNSLPSCSPEHRLRFVLNGDTIGTLQASGWGELRWSARVAPERWSAGWNRFVVQSVPADTAVTCLVAEQGVDAWEVFARPYPVALAGQWHARVAAGDTGAELTIHGFGAARVVLVDTLRQRAAILEGQPEHAARLTARAGSQAWVEAFIGDSLAARVTASGVLLLWWPPPQYEQHQQWLRAAELYQALQQLPAGTYVAGAATEAIPDAALGLLRQWGLQHGEQTHEGAAWVWATRVGDSALSREQSAPAGQWAHLFWTAPGSGNQYRVTFFLPPGDTAVIYVADERRWQWARVERVEPPSLADPEPQADVIVVAPPKLLAVAQRWADFRRRTHGVRSRIVTTTDIAVAFGNGRLTPHVLKDFLQYAYARWQPPAPQVVFLLGSATWDVRGIVGSAKPNLVPSYGVPPSDYWYTLLEGDDYVPELIIGRIPAADSAEAAAVIDKLEAWERSAADLWRKRALLIFGFGFTNTMDTYYGWLTGVLGMEPTVIQKETAEPVSSRYGPYIRQQLQEGVGLTIYFGHGAEANMEVQGWEPQRLTNAERYGILMTLSCSMGNFTVPYTRAFNEQYVVSPQRGMVAALGMAGIGWDIVERTVEHYFFQALVESRLRMLGPLYVAARLPLVPFVAQDIYRATVLQHTLLGDPLLRFPVDTVPDFAVTSGTGLYQDQVARPVQEITRGDSLRLRCVVGNLGTVPQQRWRIRLVHESAGVRDTLWVDSLPPVRWLAVWDTLLPVQWLGVGEHRLTVQLNPDSLVHESAWANNEAVLDYRVLERQMLPLEPMPFWHVRPGQLRVRVLNPLGAAGSFRYEAELWRGENRLEVASEAHLRLWDEVVEWQPQTVLQPRQRYWFRIRAARLEDTVWTQWLEVPFWTDTVSTDRWVRWQQSDSADFAANELKAMEVVRTERGAAVRLQRWRATVEALSDPVGSRALLRFNGRTFLELDQEAGIGALVFALTDTLPKVRFYRTGRVGQSEDAGYFLSLLRDSVRVGQYVAWSLSGDGLWRFSAAQLDTLRVLLRERYGAVLADSLARSGVAYAMVGRYGAARGSAVEAFRSRDSIAMVAHIEQPMPTGSLVTPWIGPARRLDTVVLHLQMPQQWTVTVYGRQSLEEPTDDVLVSTRGDTVLGLSGERYTYIRLQLDADASPDTAEPLLYGMTVSFEPQGEVALPSSAIQLQPAQIGDSLRVRLRVVNRALRAVAYPVTVRVGTRSTSQEERQRLELLEALPPDSAADFTVQLSTAGWQSEGIFWAQAYAAGELYRFNDAAEVPYRLGMDTVPPWLRLWWQDSTALIALESGSAVPRQPRLWLLLEDQAPAPLTTASALRLWIEGQPMDTTTALAYRFFGSLELDSLPPELQTPTARAALFCIPPKLPLGRILVWALGEDAAGLRDTLVVELRVVDRPTLRFLQQYPQPTRGATTVSFVYEGYTAHERVRAEVFSVLGELLFATEFPVTAGENRWQWDGVTRAGVPVAPGVYFWRLWLPRMGPAAGIGGTVVVVP